MIIDLSLVCLNQVFKDVEARNHIVATSQVPLHSLAALMESIVSAAWLQADVRDRISSLSNLIKSKLLVESTKILQVTTL